jgi:hypothetical protein
MATAIPVIDVADYPRAGQRLAGGAQVHDAHRRRLLVLTGHDVRRDRADLRQAQRLHKANGPQVALS